MRPLAIAICYTIAAMVCIIAAALLATLAGDAMHRALPALAAMVCIIGACGWIMARGAVDAVHDLLNDK